MTSKIVFLVLLGALVCSTFEARKLNVASSGQDEKFEDHGLVDGELSGGVRESVRKLDANVGVGTGVDLDLLGSPLLYLGTPGTNVGIGLGNGSGGVPSGGGK
ncbi:hypothetical protein E5676_scaffold943G00010 [Cucumis melo var. makuwa]|uniref:Uncharacterized protein n=1 Tax=Cucumis melo var. makuwa TaxID=1194695 RepID=A0A5A7VBZ1_CUCMM|nr:hypothetical protein E6C27_scaffold37G001400 [Cucumis melo var. makuwa]TYK24041.1 hypothetical protein E5676_scaffold943G00010 [Cucumis melo var. makuwa]